MFCCSLSTVCTDGSICAGGEHDTSSKGIYDISNLDRLGSSEVQLVQRVIDGVELLIKVGVVCHGFLAMPSASTFACFCPDGEEVGGRKKHR